MSLSVSSRQILNSFLLVSREPVPQRLLLLLSLAESRDRLLLLVKGDERRRGIYVKVELVGLVGAKKRQQEGEGHHKETRVSHEF